MNCRSRQLVNSRKAETTHYAARVYGMDNDNAEKDFTLTPGDFALPEATCAEVKPIRKIGFAA